MPPARSRQASHSVTKPPARARQARRTGAAAARSGARAGIDLGGTKIEAVVVDGENNVLGSSRHPTPTEGGPADVARAILGATQEACAAAGVAPSALLGVGVGSPGLVDNDKGTVTSARNLPGWEKSFPL